jgi:hypothetical protein
MQPTLHADGQPETDAPPADAVERLMPWGISLLIHLALALFAVFVIVAERRPEPADPAIVAVLRPSVQTTARMQRLPDLDGVETEAPAIAPQPSHEPASTPDPLDLIGADHHAALPPGPDKDKPVGTIPDGDDPKIIIPPGPSGPGSIIFVIDASGSMAEKFSLVQRDLGRAIRQLGPDHRFNVIFFQQSQAVVVLRRGLAAATAANKAAAIARAGEGGRIVPHGNSNPLPALRKAIAMRPDRIVLLSDNITGSGRFQLEADQLLKQVGEMTRRYRARRTVIHTVQFLRPDPHQTLRRLAEEHGGTYRFVGSARAR